MLNTKNEIRLKLSAGEAKNDAQLARILGPLKVNPAKFCLKFNDSTKNLKGIKKGDIVVAGLVVKADKTFDVNIYGIDTSRAMLKLANIKKGSQTPGKSESGTLSKAQIIELANDKLPYVRHLFDSESLQKSLIATAKSCGIKIK